MLGPQFYSPHHADFLVMVLMAIGLEKKVSREDTRDEFVAIVFVGTKTTPARTLAMMSSEELIAMVLAGHEFV